MSISRMIIGEKRYRDLNISVKSALMHEWYTVGMVDNNVYEWFADLFVELTGIQSLS